MKKIQLPQQSDDIDEKRQAWAPYNFVPLPDQIVTQKVTDLPDQGIYHKNRLTGYIDCELTKIETIYSHVYSRSNNNRQTRDLVLKEQMNFQKEKKEELNWRISIRSSLMICLKDTLSPESWKLYKRFASHNG